MTPASLVEPFGGEDVRVAESFPFGQRCAALLYALAGLRGTLAVRDPNVRGQRGSAPLRNSPRSRGSTCMDSQQGALSILVIRLAYVRCGTSHVSPGGASDVRSYASSGFL
jgi:hypothetical protein